MVCVEAWVVLVIQMYSCTNLMGDCSPQNMTTTELAIDILETLVLVLELLKGVMASCT